MKNDIRVTVRLRNNNLLKWREARGINQRRMAELAGIPSTLYAEWETLKSYPVMDGEWDARALDLADMMEQPIENIFPESLSKISKSVVEREVSVNQLALSTTPETLAIDCSPERKIHKRQLTKMIDRALSTLTYRERDCINRHFGLGEYDECT